MLPVITDKITTAFFQEMVVRETGGGERERLREK